MFQWFVFRYMSDWFIPCLMKSNRENLTLTPISENPPLTLVVLMASRFFPDGTSFAGRNENAHSIHILKPSENWCALNLRVPTFLHDDARRVNDPGRSGEAPREIGTVEGPGASKGHSRVVHTANLFYATRSNC
jgi:hypothetical protein